MKTQKRDRNILCSCQFPGLCITSQRLSSTTMPTSSLHIFPLFHGRLPKHPSRNQYFRATTEYLWRTFTAVFSVLCPNFRLRPFDGLERDWSELMWAWRHLGGRPRPVLAALSQGKHGDYQTDGRCRRSQDTQDGHFEELSGTAPSK